MLISEAAIAMQGDFSGQDNSLGKVNIDTRKIQVGDLFFAIKGHQFDGHDFVLQACEKNVLGVVIEKTKFPDLKTGLKKYLDQNKIAVIQVEDTRLALGALAKAWQRKHLIKKVALTGSCGKTSVKEIITAILNQQGRVLATQGNLNNDIGAPLTLLSLTDQHEYGVFELGANHKGEIDYTSGLVEPQVALITNADRAHLEGFGSVEKVAQAKGEIFNHLTPEGVAVINQDDPHSDYWENICVNKKIVTFSVQANQKATYQLISAKSLGAAGSELTIQTPEGVIHLKMPLMGRHQWANTLAAVAVTRAFNIAAEKIQAGLLQLKPVPGRLNPRVVSINHHEISFIDDSYNANPFSVKAAIDALTECARPQILVLGDMAELGDESAALHQDIGVYAKTKGIDQLLAVGRYAPNTISGFGENAVAVETQDQAIEQLRPWLNAAATVLVKGSRSSKMEKILEGFIL